jgi:hypothetical protein
MLNGLIDEADDLLSIGLLGKSRPILWLARHTIAACNTVAA